MKRVIVLGGLGLFGRTAVEQLGTLGISALRASRSTAAELRLDANDAPSIGAALHEGDLVIDCAGPFHARSTALVQAAISVGFDIIDINDDLGYAERLLVLKDHIDDRGIRVLSSASTVSAISAALVRHSSMGEPVSVAGFLAPATRYTANTGTARSLIQSVGRPVRVFRDGLMQTVPGWSEPRRFPLPLPVGPICGRLFETADVFYLPRTWPTLRDVAMYVDTNTPGLNTLLTVADRASILRRGVEKQMRLGAWFARRFGSSAGGFGCEIVGADGKSARYALVSEKHGYIAAVAPAVLAAKAIMEKRFSHVGFVPPDRHVEPSELIAFLGTQGTSFAVWHR